MQRPFLYECSSAGEGNTVLTPVYSSQKICMRMELRMCRIHTGDPHTLHAPMGPSFSLLLQLACQCANSKLLS